MEDFLQQIFKKKKLSETKNISIDESRDLSKDEEVRKFNLKINYKKFQ